MTRLERIKMAIERGYTCDVKSGKVYGIRGKEILSKVDGYIKIGFRDGKKRINLSAHQFVFYIAYGKIVEQIDHINGCTSDNRIENLREVTNQQNQQNQTKAKGYYFNKPTKKWLAKIGINNKQIHLGMFDNEEDARQAYLDSKKIYHSLT